MTHEAGIEAAQKLAIETMKSWNAWTPEKGVGDMLQEVFQAYLSASGMVLVPRDTFNMASYALESIVDGPGIYSIPDTDVQARIATAIKMMGANPDTFKSQP